MNNDINDAIIIHLNRIHILFVALKGKYIFAHQTIKHNQNWVIKNNIQHFPNNSMQYKCNCF